MVGRADDREPTHSLRSMLQQALDEIRSPDLGQSSCRYSIIFSKFSLMAQSIKGYIINRGMVGFVALIYVLLRDIASIYAESEPVFLVPSGITPRKSSRV